jgi:glycosyltransferase involved in cell wall biosynthesis
VILGGSIKAWDRADAVILPLQGTAVDAYRAILGAGKRRQRIGLWGHVKSYVSPPSQLDMAAERWLMNRADQVFAYTPGGTEYAIATGIEAKKITTVMNSIDTGNLEIARSSVTQDSIRRFRTKYGLAENRTISYIGALDQSKRIDFLREVLDVLWTRDPSVRILVGGRGKQEDLLRPAVDRGQCVLLGHVDDYSKALMARVSSAFVIPGRIGLVAVESLVLGIPVLSTDWPYHAPEREYLKEGSSLFTSVNSVECYVELILGRLYQSFGVTSTAERNSYPTLDEMVRNYAIGIRNMMSN